MTTGKKTGIGTVVLWLLALFGLGLMVWRFVAGLGAVTNLSDGYPWGLWIGIDILAGIALAAGGFVLAGVVHLFGGAKYHALTRPAILTAFLGYLLFIFGLMVDLGRPWNLYQAIFHWNHLSPMFEVAWCVMMYTTVLFLEFLPPVFEKFKWNALHKLWHALVPFFIIAILTLFTFAMSDSMTWTIIIFVVLLFWEVMMRAGAMPRDKQMPILLIMAGIIFSTMHQSSLGSIFLLAPDKLHVLWFTPIIPILFFLSAVMVAPAMIVVETMSTAKADGHDNHFSLLSTFTKGLPWLLIIYLVVKLVDLGVRGAFGDAFAFDGTSISWLLEIIIGVLLPLFILFGKGAREKPGTLLFASWLVVIGLIWNRVNVSMVGVKVDEWAMYIPAWSEVFITLGIFSIGILAMRWAGKFFPIHEH